MRSCRLFRYWSDTKDCAHRSVFRQTFVSVLCALLCVAVLFVLLMDQMAFRDLQKSNQESHSHVLQKAASLVDITLDTLLDDMENLAASPVIVNTAVLPGSSQSQRNLQSITQLKSFLDRSPYIVSVAFLTTYDGTVYTPYDGITALAQFPKSELFFNQEAADLPNRSAELVSDVGTVYLRLPLLPSLQGPLGLLLVGLDVQALCQDLCGQMQGLTILSAAGSVLFQETEDDAFSQLPSKLQTLSPGLQLGKNGRNTWLVWTSQSSGLTFFYPYETPAAVLGFSGQTELLWSLIGILLIVLLIALFVSMRFYQPLRRLLRIAPADGTNDLSSGQNEWDALSRIITSMQGETAHFQNMVSLAAPDIQRRLLTDLIDGTPLTEETLRLTLLGIKSELDPQGLSALFVAADCAAGVLTAEYLKPCLAKLEKLLIPQAHLVSFEYLQTLVVLAQFPRPADAGEETLTELTRILGVYLKPIPHVQIGCSGFFRGLSGMQGAYEAAYTAAFQTGSAGIRGADLAASIPELLRELPEQTPPTGERMLAYLCRRLREYGGSPEEQAQLAAQLIRSVDELARSMHAEVPPLPEPDPGTDPLDRAEQHAQAVLTGLYDLQERRRNRYLTDAMAYLNQYYAQPDLSLRSVADHIGITPSYLSKLFNSAYQKGFGQSLNHIRIEHAKTLLLESNQKIREIGEHVGFLSVQNFMRVFKRECGCTPGEYRQSRSAAGPDPLRP